MSLLLVRVPPLLLPLLLSSDGVREETLELRGLRENGLKHAVNHWHDVRSRDSSRENKRKRKDVKRKALPKEGQATKMGPRNALV
jgi:hypothetical protein